MRVPGKVVRIGYPTPGEAITGWHRLERGEANISYGEYRNGHPLSFPVTKATNLRYIDPTTIYAEVEVDRWWA